MTRARQALGRFGEDSAARWYEERGYRILARNWRVREGELDLVVARDRVLVFCEVKTRSSTRFGSAAEAVDVRKQRQVRAVARRFLAEEVGRAPAAIRFDVAAVTPEGVTVIEAAF